MSDNREKLWREFFATRNSATKEKLIIEYAPLVKLVAGRLSMHLGQHVEFEDLVGYGIFGLIDALDRYDQGKGVKFETYASLRIRGEIIDSIRRMDWVPRALRQKNKQLEQTFSSLEDELGREPTEEEIAVKLNITVDETSDLLKKTTIVSLISLNDYLEQNNELPQKYDASPESEYERLEVRQLLTDAIDKLTEKERTVVTLYYFEDLTLKEISKTLGVSESRVSQIHSKAVLKLQGRLGKFKSVLYF
ncbi:MAG: FliA/WhiG family RNA polymerase sigma factor [Clostridiales bacterium]|nr:FliA/WhiG family RNA polymerase sigma factor [Clostridiales bacterium]